MARAKHHIVSLTPTSASAFFAVATVADLSAGGTIVNAVSTMPGNEARTVIFKTGQASATASATTTLVVSGTDLWGNATSESIVSQATASSYEGSVYFRTITSAVVATATNTQLSVEMGYSNKIRTQWVPINHHSDGGLTMAIKLGGSAGDANLRVNRTYSPILAETSAVAFSSATISVTSTEVTYTTPFMGYMFELNGSIAQVANIWVYQHDIASD